MTVLELDTGMTAWILTSASLVLLMTPGLAMFYGGMTRAKSVLNMMMMSFGALALVGVLWVIYGYSVAYGTSIGSLFGNPADYFGMAGAMAVDPEAELPLLVDVGFQAVFAIITVALISGAIADRARFGAWMIFAGIWASLVYFPVAHWVWGSGGWIGDILGAVDFAGGTAVHINAGAAALALALVLGRRIGFKREPMRPHNLPLVMLGAGLLWFGWFGFNAGSAYNADNTAGVAWVNTLVATCAAILGWLITERIRDGKPTSLGAASGAVAGLVAITPACGALSPIGSILLGVVAGVLCALAVGLKYKFGYDDSLDVVGVHLVGGLWGTIGIGFLATPNAPDAAQGLFFGGGVDLLWRQIVGAVAVMIYSFVIAYLIGIVLQKTIGFRITADDEQAGVDTIEHAETAYDLGTIGGARTSVGVGASRPPANDGSHADRSGAHDQEVTA
jgi:ammonium transporter, Amt family